jgi:beta-lactamase regulating signal transducer with metallopeptidase domain
MIHVALFGIHAGWSVLLTYLLHSTAWIAGALLLTRLHRVLSPAARHVVWRATLLGPLASSALALGLDHGWQWALTQANPASEAGAAALAPQVALRPPELSGSVELVRDAAGQAAPLREAAASLPWSALLAGVWAFVALVGVLLIARAALRQRRAFEPRTRITDGACVDALERLARRAGLRHPVRLSFSAAASTPLVLGAREICLPERAVELEPGALEAVFAHELAHIERRDSLWLNGALLLQALLWFQPLHRKARAELQESAELAADERAVELTGDPLGLARTLAHVAGWVTGRPPVASVAMASVAMARPGSAIVERVARLVESSEAAGGVRLSSRTPWFALAALAAIGACSPSVGAPQAEVPSAGRGPSTPDEQSQNQPAPLVAANSAAPLDASQPAPAPAPTHDARVDHDAPDSDDHPDPEPAAMPQLPIEGMVGDIVAGVVPRAIEFSSKIGQLANDEVQLELRIDAAQRAAAEPGAPPESRAQLARLKRDLAASRQRREELERDFEARMDAWGKDFEQRFERDHAQRFAAWGEQFGRRMEAMAKGLERQLSQRRPPKAVPGSPGPMVPSRPPKVPTPPRPPRD